MKRFHSQMQPTSSRCGEMCVVKHSIRLKENTILTIKICSAVKSGVSVLLTQNKELMSKKYRKVLQDNVFCLLQNFSAGQELVVELYIQKTGTSIKFQVFDI